MEVSQKILYTKREAAAMLSISVRTLEYRLARGEIRAIHKGRSVRIHRKEMERWAKIDDAAVIEKHAADTSAEQSVNQSRSNPTPELTPTSSVSESATGTRKDEAKQEHFDSVSSRTANGSPGAI